MKTNKSDFRHESIQDNQSIQSLLKALANGIKNQEITFSDEDDTLVMNPKGLLDLKVTASQDGNDNRISIRIKWQTEPEKNKQKSNLTIK